MITGKSIAKGAMVVMGATLLSRLFGFFREMVIANRFGATGETDAYLVAFSVPVGVAMAVAAGISAGFIPVLNSYLVQQDREDANKVANTLINIVFVVLALTVGAAMAGAPFLVRLLAPGFSGEALALTVEMIRIMFPALAFVSLMGIASGFLNSHRHFLFPALGPLIASVFIIGAAVILGPAMGIRGLAVGTLAGYICQFLVQVPVMYKKGFRYRLEWDPAHPGVIRVFRLMVPVLAASMAPPLILIVERGLASELGTGSISALNYAFRLMQLPLGLFLMAVSVPIFPALSSFAAQKDLVRLKETLVKGVNVLALIMIPAAAGLIALSVPIVRLLFERGAFEAADTIPTAYALSVYALALLPFAVRDIFRRGFYSMQDTITPVAVTVGGFLINVALDLLLVRIIGLGGLALGAVLTALAEAAALFFLLDRKLAGLPGRSLLVLFLKLGAASLIMGVSTYYVGTLAGSAINLAAGTGRVLQVGLSVGFGFLVYLGAVTAFKVEEVGEAYGLLKGLLRKVAKGRLN